MNHKNAISEDIHTPFTWLWDDVAAKNAMPALESTDIGKIGLQLDNNVIWLCTESTPTFVQLTVATVTSISTSASSEVSNARNITLTLDVPISVFVILWVSTAPGGSVASAATITGGLWQMGHTGTSCVKTNGDGIATFTVTYTSSGTVYVNAVLPNGNVFNGSGISYT